MRVLLTNDDGVESEGIGAVRVALAEFSDRVVTVAPEADPARRAADVSVLTRPGRRAYPRTAMPGWDGDGDVRLLYSPGFRSFITRLTGEFPPPGCFD